MLATETGETPSKITLVDELCKQLFCTINVSTSTKLKPDEALVGCFELQFHYKISVRLVT